MGSSRFARRYSGNRRLLSCPPGTEIFHFPGLASVPYGFRDGCTSITWYGFPHSGISGLTPVSGFPELIAAYYALPRLRAPRHPPYALPRLTIDLASTDAVLIYSYQRTRHAPACVHTPCCIGPSHAQPPSSPPYTPIETRQWPSQAYGATCGPKNRVLMSAGKEGRRNDGRANRLQDNVGMRPDLKQVFRMELS